MNFFIQSKKHVKNERIEINYSVPFKSRIKIDKSQIFLWTNNERQNINSIQCGDDIYIILGDLIVPKNFLYEKEKYYNKIFSNFTPEKLKYLKGFFYLIHYRPNSQFIRVYSSIFSILPIYYCKDSKSFYISSNYTTIIKNLNTPVSINKIFVLEKTLFNYSIFNNTYFEGIYTVPTNSFLCADSELKTIKHTDITDFYVCTPKPWKKSVDEMTDVFVENIRDYFPEQKFSISFTGGFDGRTLIASAIDAGKKFSAYSFGTSDSQDVAIPMSQAEKLKIDFIPIFLDNNFIEESFDLGMELIDTTDGNASFARAHYLYAAKLLKNKGSFIITGNFGSELFRSMHIAGVMISEELIKIFSLEKEKDWIKYLTTSRKLNALNMYSFKTDFDDLIEQLIEFKNKISNNFTLNQRFYVFIFEEVFRKYFGPEIIMQNNFLTNRTPYLNFKFIEKLLQTELAGVYSDFFENNPIKRFKGQVLYANIIQKCCPALSHLKTGKGYRPIDLITVLGKLNLVWTHLNKKIGKNMQDKDPFAVSKALNYNIQKLEKIKIIGELFNVDCSKRSLKEQNAVQNLNAFITLLSMNYYIGNQFQE